MLVDRVAERVEDVDPEGALRDVVLCAAANDTGVAADAALEVDDEGELLYAITCSISTRLSKSAAFVSQIFS
jgi:hypothetical protein